MNAFSRRRLLKMGLYSLFAGGGAVAGMAGARKIWDASAVANVVDEIYGVTKDVLTEVQGAAEKRLSISTDKVRGSLGRTAEEAETLKNYWEKVGVMGEKNYTELSDALDRAEFYIEEADIGERLIRLKDRLAERTIKVDQAIESKYPSPVRKFNEWFSESIKGKDRGSRDALEAYNGRVKALVMVYDANKDNVISQADLLNQTDEHFREAQRRVVSTARNYISSEGISENEKNFYREIVAVSERDDSGKAMADLILDTRGYFMTLEVAENLGELNKEIEKATKEVRSLQDLMDEGLVIKERLRSAADFQIPRLQGEVDSYVESFEEKRQHLASEGYDINYDLYPRLTAVRDKALSALNTGRDIASYAGAGIGAAAAAWVYGFFAKRGDRRAFKQTAKELELVRAENAALIAKNESKVLDQKSYIAEGGSHI